VGDFVDMVVVDMDVVGMVVGDIVEGIVVGDIVGIEAGYLVVE
jgi:hypothetical protein